MKLLKKDTNKVVEKPLYTDLRQVMDYNRDFSMFYSGVEYEVYLDGCYAMGVRNFLMSYEYLKGKGASSIKKHPDMHLFIDSGAFTYMNDPKYADYTIEQWEEQIDTYLKWAEHHKESIFAMAELDLQNMLGIETIQRWRRDFFEPFMLRTGIPVCFIYHQEGESTWDKMCERYPYVGFSAISDKDGSTLDLDTFREMLRTAEKYNSLVHGFGMTRTSILPELPFYTVDSTSWKAGFRYGQIAIWNGKKVQMFRKDDFDSRVVPIIRTYPDITLDESLLITYYEPEVLRANVYAYQKAEEYIIDRQKPLTYWKKAKAVKVDIENLSEDFFPPLEWFDSDTHEGIADYARKMNLNPEFPDLFNLLYDTTAFCTWGNPDYQKMHDWYFEPKQEGLIAQLHDTYINRIVPDIEAKVEDLKNFFLECVSGENDKLLQLGTNFDRIVKERESYIEDEEEELVDLPEVEVRSRLKALMPAESDGEDIAPEMTLDEEIYKQADIVPTFDENGRFVKGQVAIRKPKKMYSKKYPKFACDTCYAAAKCPEFKQGFVCAYHKMFNRFDTRDMADIIQAMQGMVEHNLTRMQRAMVMEVLNGTVDPQVTSFIDQNMRLINNLKQMYEFGSPEVLRQTRIIRADGSQEETTSITNPQSGGILEKLFGSFSESKKDRPTLSDEDELISAVDAEVEEEDAPKKNDRYTEKENEFE